MEVLLKNGYHYEEKLKTDKAVVYKVIEPITGAFICFEVQMYIGGWVVHSTPTKFMKAWIIWREINDMFHLTPIQ
jgi:hypothetical protein